MRILAAIALTLGVELLLGAAMFALAAWSMWSFAGRRQIIWVRAARALGPAAPLGAVLLGVAALLLLAGGGPSPSAARIWVNPAPFAVTGGLAVAGSYLLLHAGSSEARGRLPASRRMARFGGSALLFGILAQLVLVWRDLLFIVPFRRAALGDTAPALALALAMLALGVAAFVGLVAGLAGKPRPSGYFSTLLHLLGASSLAWVAQLTSS